MSPLKVIHLKVDLEMGARVPPVNAPMVPAVESSRCSKNLEINFLWYSNGQFSDVAQTRFWVHCGRTKTDVAKMPSVTTSHYTLANLIDGVQHGEWR